MLNHGSKHSCLYSIPRNNRKNKLNDLIFSSLLKFKLKRSCDDHSKKVTTNYLMFGDICFNFNILR